MSNLEVVKALSPQEQLKEAILSGNLRQVKKLLNYSNPDKQAQINGNIEEETPLMTAVYANQLKIVKYLAENGAEIEAKNANGETPLFIAAANGYIPIMDYLRKQKWASIYTTNNIAHSIPLHAAENGNIPILNYLLQEGWDINEKLPNHHDTLLHVAISCNQEETVKFLIKNNANPNILTGYGTHPLQIAIKENFKITQFLIEEAKVDVNSLSYDKMTPLMTAVIYNLQDCVTYLLEQGANIDLTDKSGWSALSYAIMTNNLELTKYLIEKGANIFATDDKNHGKSALHLACFHNKTEIEIIKYILSLNKNIEITDNDGDTPLHCCAQTLRLPKLQCLLEHNANVNVINNEGKTPLMMCGCSDEIAQALIQKGADVNICDNNGNVALIHALSQRNPSVVKCLVDNGADITIQNNNGLSPIDYILHSEHAFDEKALDYMLTGWTNQNKNITPSELIILQETNHELLEKLLITGKLLKLFKEQKYEQQLKMYPVAKKILSPQNRKEYETIIRKKRQTNGCKENE